MHKKVIFTIIILLLTASVLLVKFAPQGVEFVRSIPQAIVDPTSLLKHTSDGRTNILLLGIGGGTHDGPDLTDSIIFASIDFKNKKANLVSVPRDLWIPDRSEKINAVYSDAEMSQKGTGLPAAKQELSSILGQPIQYGVRIDFGGFVKAVDEVGGLDLTVERTFDDYAYPITGQEDATCGHSQTEIQSFTQQIASGSATDLDSFPCRYEHLHFDKGLTHMDGAKALKYVRSRHALGPEGTDFARSKRQSNVINAFKNKVFSTDTLLNPGKVLGLFGILSGSIDTDISQTEIPLFVKAFQEFKTSKVTSAVIDLGDSSNPLDQYGLLTNPPMADYGGAWVIIPREGKTNYSEIQNYISCELQNGDCIVPVNSGDPIISASATMSATLTPAKQ